jgi:uncharacterized membrane protein YedE/YeeE
MRNFFAALSVGLIFGAGLVVSDMVNPARVLAFLDLAGAWDPTLAFVMIGALVPSTIAYLIRPRMPAPVLGAKFYIPENRVVDRQLFGGAVLFGAGWGLVGLCPGPAISALSFGYWQPWPFVAAMLAGMLLHRVVTTRRTGVVTRPPAFLSDADA